MIFMHFIDVAQQMDRLSYNMYVECEKEGDLVTVHKKGNCAIYSIVQSYAIFETAIEMRKDNAEVAQNLRRWQLATDGI